MSEQDASRWVATDAPRGKYYIKNYYGIQPALIYGYAHPDPKHPWGESVTAPGPQAVRRELENVMRFWLEKGADGFRVDLASSLVKGDPDKVATIALWKDMSGWFHGAFQNAVLIAEWFNPKQSIAAGFDVDFLKPRQAYVRAGERQNDRCQGPFRKGRAGQHGGLTNFVSRTV